MSNFINVVYGSSYSENKDDVAFFILDYRISDQNLHYIRHSIETADILTEDFNVFLFNIGKKTKNIEQIISLYPRLNFTFINNSHITILRKKDSEDSLKINKQTIIDECDKSFNFIKNLKCVFISPKFLLASLGYNDKIDYIGDDINEINTINTYIEKINKDIENKIIFPYTAFMSRDTRIAHDVAEYLLDKYKCTSYQFIMDPEQYTHYFYNKYNSKIYYFENDFRGTRKYNEFPVGQLSYIYKNKNIEDVPEFKDKENKFIWGGVVLRAERIQDWYVFFDKFIYEKSALHVSNGGGTTSYGNRVNNKKIEQDSSYKKTFESIQSHPLNVGLLPVKDYENKLKMYKYTFIQKCLSKYDSLNFRIYYSLLYNVIPFIDSRYDVEHLQIPKKFKDRLSVSNSDDIMNLIKYFDDNSDEAEQLLKDLKDYYFNDKYSDINYYLYEFRNNYFKEIYK